MGKLAFSNMLDYVRVTDAGDAYVDLSKLTRDQAAAITEITVEEFKDGRGKDARDVRRTRLKLADKKDPLLQLGRHLGGFNRSSWHDAAPDGVLATFLEQIRGITRSAIPVTQQNATERLSTILPQDT